MLVFNQGTITLFILVVTYAILATEFGERTIAAMSGAGAVWAFGIPGERIAETNSRT